MLFERLGQITTLAMPVSSSIIRSRTPLAEPGLRLAPLAEPTGIGKHGGGAAHGLSSPGLFVGRAGSRTIGGQGGADQPKPVGCPFIA